MSFGPRNKQKMSQRGERKTANEFGGRVQPASGSQWHSKADVKSTAHLFERKDTMSSSYRLKLGDLQKLAHHAIKADRLPVMVVSIQGAEWAILPLTDLKALLPSDE